MEFSLPPELRTWYEVHKVIEGLQVH
jgi:hypothetical protein